MKFFFLHICLSVYIFISCMYYRYAQKNCFINTIFSLFRDGDAHMYIYEHIYIYEIMCVWAWSGADVAEVRAPIAGRMQRRQSKLTPGMVAIDEVGWVDGCG